MPRRRRNRKRRRPGASEDAGPKTRPVSGGDAGTAAWLDRPEPVRGRIRSRSGASLAEEFGMSGEPDIHKHDKMKEFIDSIHAAMDRRDFDRNEFIHSLRSSGVEEGAIGLVSGVMNLHDDDQMSTHMSATQAIHAGRFKHAIKMVEEFERQSGRVDFLSRCDILVNTGRLEEALALCDRELDSSPHRSGVHYHKFEVLRELGRVQEQADLCDRWAAESPDDPDMMVCRARMMVDAGNADGAEELIRKVLKIEPITIPAYIILGDILVSRGDPAGTIRILNKALDLDENENDVYARKAEVLMEMGEHGKALSCCEQRLKIIPGYRKLRQARDRARAAL